MPARWSRRSTRSRAALAPVGRRPSSDWCGAGLPSRTVTASVLRVPHGQRTRRRPADVPVTCRPLLARRPPGVRATGGCAGCRSDGDGSCGTEWLFLKFNSDTSILPILPLIRDAIHRTRYECSGRVSRPPRQSIATIKQYAMIKQEEKRGKRESS